MLVITRRVGEVVVITTPDGLELRVTVTVVDGVSCRLGFTAPRDVVVDRLEIHERRKASKGDKPEGGK